MLQTPPDPTGESVWSAEQVHSVVTDDRDIGITVGRLGWADTNQQVLLLITREESCRKLVMTPLLPLPCPNDR